MEYITIDTNKVAVNVYNGTPVSVSSSMFGGIHVNQSKGSDYFFEANVEYMGIHHIRWPGGSLSEFGSVTETGQIYFDPKMIGELAYGLEFPELMNPKAMENQNGYPYGRSGLSDVLQMAIHDSSSLSIILPTMRYASNPSEAYQATIEFLNRLFVSGSFNNGNLPDDIILEIGNENYDVKAYAAVSMEILRAISDFRDSFPSVDFSVAIEAMQSKSETKQLISIFEDIFLPSKFDNLLSEVDIVRIHTLDHSYSYISSIEDTGTKRWSLSYMLDAVVAARADDGNINPGDVDVYFSAWTTTSNDIIPNLYAGMPSASAAVNLFAAMIEMGADYAAIWGLGRWDPGLTTVSLRDGNASRYTAVGETFRLMSESLVGTSLLITPSLDGPRGDELDTFAFADYAKTVLFLCANDLDVNYLDVTTNLQNFGSVGFAWAESVSTLVGISGEVEIRNPEVSWNGSTISTHLDRDYEVSRVIVMKADNSVTFRGSMSDDIIRGGNSADYLRGLAGNDTFFGHSDADTIDGGGGNDTASWEGTQAYLNVDMSKGTFIINGDIGKLISMENIVSSEYGSTVVGNIYANTLIGGRGVDTLSGQRGHDRLYGMSGNDVLLGGFGNDVIYGGDGNDFLNGQSHDDFLYGEKGNDTLMGGMGNDVLDGGVGDDILYGHGGADSFIFSKGYGRDAIADFNLRHGDKILLSNFINVSGVVDMGYILANSMQVGSNVEINFGDGDILVISGISLSSMTHEYFVF